MNGDAMKTVKITLTTKELERLAGLLGDFACELMDDGRDDSPDAELIWKVRKQLTAELA
jgi:hypothetical protein